VQEEEALSTAWKLLLAFSIAVIGLATGAAGASATFHFNKIREFYPGSTGTPDTAYLELQAYAGGQNLVSGKKIETFDSTGNLEGTTVFTFPSDAAHGQDQDTILVGDTAAAGTPDFANPSFSTNFPTLSTGGAICFVDPGVFGGIDCVSWGNFTGSLPSPAGTPLAPTGIPNGMAVTRSIAPGCPTLLESADDSDNSAADFSLSSPNPRNNAVTPTETRCAPSDGGGSAGPAPDSGGGEPAQGGAPKKKCKKHKHRSALAAKKCKKHK
jgi:hypothetical protein